MFILGFAAENLPREYFDTRKVLGRDGHKMLTDGGRGAHDPLDFPARRGGIGTASGSSAGGRAQRAAAGPRTLASNCRAGLALALNGMVGLADRFQIAFVLRYLLGRWSCILFPIFGAVPAWWFRGSVDEGEIRGLEAPRQALQEQMRVSGQRLSLARKQMQMALEPARDKTRSESRHGNAPGWREFGRRNSGAGRSLE